MFYLIYHREKDPDTQTALRCWQRGRYTL